VDGDISEWKRKKPIFTSDELRLFVMSDEKYLYIMLSDLRDNVEIGKYYIGLDIVSNLGSKTYTEGGVSFSRPVDIILAIDGRDNSRVLVESSEDVYYRKWSRSGDFEVIGLDGEKVYIGFFMPIDPRLEQKNSGIFNIWRMLLCRPLYLPQTKELIPLEYFEVGRLIHGNSNPVSPDYSNLADFFVNPGNSTMEMRIPWMLLNAADPSSRMFFGDLYAEKEFGTYPIKVEGIYFEARRAGSNESSEPGYYTWKAWEDTPTFHERLKESYAYVQKKFAEY
jgi:hypothetical protein